MTGSQESGQGERPARQQPPMQNHTAASAQAPAPQPTEAVDPDQERIEIPAFLRRQAN
jgi:cell division protein FtsZ